MPKISVIIPVYGVEPFIERCARSLFEQTLDEMEFVFVNDCTLDNSIQILDSIIKEYREKLAKHHHQVQVICMPQNGGLHKVRKFGLQFCSGEYIAHCDSDDWVDPNMYLQMYEKAIEDNADMVICEYYMSDGKSNWVSNPSKFKDKNDLLRKCLAKISSWAVWNKIAKRKFYDNCFVYPVGVMGEDSVITTQLILQSKRISHVDAPLYYYYINSASITHTTNKALIIKKHNDAILNTQILIQQISKYNLAKQYRKEIEAIKFRNKSILIPLIKEPIYYKMWKKSNSEITCKIFFNRYITAREKIIFLLMLLRLKK